MPIRIAIVCLALGIAWLLSGRRLTLLLDRFVTIRAVNLPSSSVTYDGGGWQIGGMIMTFAGTNNLRSDVRVTVASAKRAVLMAGNAAFPLGPLTGAVDPQGRPDLDFTADSGDAVSFTAGQSLLSWPTPFEFKILGGHSPWWRRYVYYRLAWKKPTGATLEMLWRYQQEYYSGLGWTTPDMMWNSQTGLLWTKIKPGPQDPERSAAEYIERTKGWKRGDYRIESRGPSTDGLSDVFAVIYLADEQATHPGAGKSVEVYLDRASRQVTKELGGQ